MSTPAIVARFFDWNEAQMARGLLESNGISCHVGDSHIAAIEWGITLGTGGIKLTVLDPGDAPEARRLLEDVRSGSMHRALDRIDTTGVSDPDEPIERCPSCQSADVFRPRSLLSAVVTALLAAPMPLASNQRHCRACGHQWKESESLL
jgi:hypothetical protein